MSLILHLFKRENMKFEGYKIDSEEESKAFKKRIVKNGDVVLIHINHPTSNT